MESAKTCPVAGVTEIDFNSREFQENFKEIYTEMHASGCPFAHSTRGDHYAVASHAHLTQALLKPNLWRSKYGPGLPYQPEDEPGVLVAVDPPEHTFEAKIAGRAFSKAYFDSFEPRIQAFLDQAIDEVYALGAADIHEVLSEALPLFVICEMLGIESTDEQGERRPRFRAELKRGVGFMTMPADLRGGITQRQASGSFSRDIFVEHLERCKANLASGKWQGGENLVTRFLTTEIDGKRLSDDKILGFCGFLLTAGSATTTILLSNILFRLLSAPEVFERVKNDLSLVPQAIEEVLRIDAPVQGLFRTNDLETELGPLHVQKDTKVMMLWAGANLDPTVFEDPLTFNIDRETDVLRKHVAFGHGIHICRGAPLARMEGKLFLETVIKRLPNLRFNGEVKPELSMPVLQGIASFPVAWDVN